MNNLFSNAHQKSCLAFLLWAIAFAICVSFFHGINVLFSLLLLLIGLLAAIYSLHSWTKNIISSLFMFVTLLIGLCFVPNPYQLLISIALFVIFAFLLSINRNSASLALQNHLTTLSQLKLSDWAIWIFLSFHFIFAGYFYQDNFYTLDLFHPIYEASIGNSYLQSIIQPPDLSYAGKLMRYHFLSTGLPHYFSNVFHLSLLSSVYFFTPIFLTTCFFILFNSFSKKYTDFKIPSWILFSFPLFAFNLRNVENLLNRLVSTCSFELAYVLMMFCTYFLIERKTILMCLAALMLLLTKAPFFLVFVGGAILFNLKLKNYKQTITNTLVLSIIFIIGFKLFLSGAHQQNHWEIRPFLYYVHSLPTIILFFSFLALSLFIYFFKHSSNILLAISAISLAGLSSTLIITEGYELNSIQFIMACYIFLPVILWKSLHILTQKNISMRRPIVTIICVIAFLFLTSTLIEKYIKHIRYAVEIYAQENPRISDLLKNRVIKPTFQKKISIPSLPKSFIESYAWLENNIPQNSIVLFGKHYETIWNITPWQADSGFIRSALSAKQMYNENARYKGITAQKDFFHRFSNSLHFYNYFVIPSSKNKEKMYLCYNEPSMYNEVTDELKSLPSTQKWAIDFLHSSEVNYIILEDQDQPSEFLKTITSIVFKNPTVTILKVNTNL